MINSNVNWTYWQSNFVEFFRAIIVEDFKVGVHVVCLVMVDFNGFHVIHNIL